MTPFMRWPWIGITLWCLLLTTYLELYNEWLLETMFSALFPLPQLMLGALTHSHGSPEKRARRLTLARACRPIE